jgi:hypothetical protein
MNIYDVYFRTDLHWAMRSFAAGTPKKALQLALSFASAPVMSLDFDHIEPTHEAPVREIEVRDKNGRSKAVWRDDDMRLRLAARSLLIAAENVLDRWKNGDIEEVIHQVVIAVAEAKEAVL